MKGHENFFSNSPSVRQGLRYLDKNGMFNCASPLHREDDDIFPLVTKEIREKEYLPTLLKPRGEHELTRGSLILVTEIGGSNYRAWLAEAVSDSAVDFVRDKHNRKIGIELPIPENNRKFDDPYDFFRFLNNMARPALVQIKRYCLERKHPVDALGNIYSFPGTAERIEGNVLTKPSKVMSKGFAVGYIDSIFVGKCIASILSDKPFDIPFSDDLAIVDSGDATAAAIDSATEIAIIVGTGFGGAIIQLTPEGLMFVNAEFGDLRSFPLSRIEKIVNKTMESAGHHYSEMKVGGNSMAEVLKYLLYTLHHQGIIPYRSTGKLSSSHISNILDAERGTMKSFLKNYNPGDKETFELLSQIAIRQLQEAGQTIGFPIAGTINAFPDLYPQSTVECGVEGSTFGMPGLPELSKAFADSYAPGKNFVFKEAQGSLGIAYAAARLKKEQNNK